MSPQQGLGILDAAEWDEVKQDWDTNNKAPWKAEWKPASPGLMSPSLRSPKARWALNRLRSVVFPKAPKSPSSSEPLRRTAYLDGLRGFAAFLVYWHHHELWAHDGASQDPYFESAFGWNGRHYFVTLPGVRTFFTGGHWAVATFFVISGYVLSAKPLQLIHSGQQDKLADNLSSSLFRRWLRLYVPLIVTTFFYMLTWHLFGGLWIDAVEKEGSLRAELWHYYAEFKNFSFIFNCGGEPWFSYNVHTWSIPVEFKGSIVIFTALLAFARCTRNARLWCQVGLISYFMYICDGWFCAMFCSGMLLCDLDLLAAAGNLPQPLASLERYKEFIFYHLFVIAVYFGGIPSMDQDVATLKKNRGWYYLSYLKPQAVFDYKWFFLFWAATLTVAASSRLWWLKRFFETHFCQYLGRVSYALYLVHGPILWIAGDRLYTAVGWGKENSVNHLPWWANSVVIPKAGPLGLELSFLLPHVILLPLTLWTAEIVTRCVDEPSVRFAQWCYKRVLNPQAAAPGPSLKA